MEANKLKEEIIELQGKLYSYFRDIEGDKKLAHELAESLQELLQKIDKFLQKSTKNP